MRAELIFYDIMVILFFLYPLFLIFFDVIVMNALDDKTIRESKAQQENIKQLEQVMKQITRKLEEVGTDADREEQE